MNILVLGGTGYLGGNVVNSLIREGHDVFCVVRPTSDTGRIRKEGPGSVMLLPNDVDWLERVFRETHFECIINAVCTYKPNASLYGDMFESNVVFPLSILNLAIKYKADHFITIGTTLPESFNVYSFTKGKFADFGCFLSRKDDISFTELKLEMFYGGEHEPKSRFLRSCRDKLLKGERILLTEGTQKRDLVRVEDVVGVIGILVENPFPNGFRKLELGCGEQHSIRRIVSYMKGVSGSCSELCFGSVSMRRGEPDTVSDNRWLDGIGYTLKYDFFGGLSQYMNDCRQEM